MNELIRKTLKRFGYVPEIQRTKLLVNTKEEVVVRQVRDTLVFAKDWYAMRGRRILSVDLGCYIGAFDEVQKLDRLDNSTQPTSKALN